MSSHGGQQICEKNTLDSKRTSWIRSARVPSVIGDAFVMVPPLVLYGGESKFQVGHEFVPLLSLFVPGRPRESHLPMGATARITAARSSGQTGDLGR
jgi:hypothetical protein